MTTELDLKYRPKKFVQVLGNKGVVDLLLRRSRSGTLKNQSMMFGGPKGCGKTTLARIVARAIHCDDLDDGEPCGKCDSCEAIFNESSPSFDEFDAATQGTAEKVRSIIKDLDYVSLDGKPRICILDEAHRLSKTAQDVFLKPVEDRRLVIIFCTTDAKNVQEAIRSRMEEYPVLPPSKEELILWMEAICKNESLDYESEALSTVATMTDRCPRMCANSLSTLSQLGGITEDLTRTYFRLESWETVVSVVRNVWSDQKVALNLLDSLADRESPSWIKDKLIRCLTCVVRLGVGSSYSFPVSLDGISQNIGLCSHLAMDLASIVNPNIYDLESVILKNSTPVVHVLPSKEKPSIQDSVLETLQKKPPVQPVQVLPSTYVNKVELPKEELKKKEPEPSKPKGRVGKVIEVQGISFSSDERLTSLDGKIGKERPPSERLQSDEIRPKGDPDYVPITEGEFARNLLKGLEPH